MENKSDFTLSSTEESLHPYYTLGEIGVFLAKKITHFIAKLTYVSSGEFDGNRASLLKRKSSYLHSKRYKKLLPGKARMAESSRSFLLSPCYSRDRAKGRSDGEVGFRR